jgi:hypothetical protein
MRSTDKQKTEKKRKIAIDEILKLNQLKKQRNIIIITIMIMITTTTTKLHMA